MCKKANELIRKQQNLGKWFDPFWWYFANLKQSLPTDFAENLLARKKFK